MKETVEDNNLPLRAEIVGRTLSITIGEETLAFAFENNEDNNPFNIRTNDFELMYRVVDSKVFAEDVIAEINREGEDGTTPLTRFLDDMMMAAVENGSLGIDGGEEGSNR